MISTDVKADVKQQEIKELVHQLYFVNFYIDTLKLELCIFHLILYSIQLEIVRLEQGRISTN